jgi:hypothetical protein
MAATAHESASHGGVGIDAIMVYTGSILNLDPWAIAPPLEHTA